ncbi:MAG: hypothetical protein IT176_06730 [Acidobacteria bacterium]|nr:hypothetical protein [Acidobacteriota bacterium]
MKQATRAHRCAPERGTTLVELVVSMALLAAVSAGIIAAIDSSRGIFAAAGDAADLQQRLRVAAETLSQDLARAGAGADRGDRAGPLLGFLAPIRPLQMGSEADAMTILYVPATAVQTTLAADLMPGSTRLQAALADGCPFEAPHCGIQEGMTLLVYDDNGRSDLLSVESVAADHAEVATLLRPAGSLRPLYATGATLVEAVARTYWRRPGGPPPSDQLMRDDAPVLDHVVGLAFEFFGDPQPPQPTADGRATYGPPPRAPDVPAPAYPSGESCTFRFDGAAGAHVPRLASLSGAGALVRLTAAQLSDGPWCPDEADANRWDADLLRIRSVAIAVRVEAAAPWLRGPVGPGFRNGGTAHDGRWVPDQEIRWVIAPRNMQ